MKKLRDNENVVVLGAFLGVTALISALVLSVVFQMTHGAVEAARLRAMQSSLKMLRLPEFDNQPHKEEKIYFSPEKFKVAVMPVRKGGELKAFAVRSISPDGYAGEVEITASFDLDGRIIAVLVTRHNETPGLGSNVCERKFRKTIFNFYKPLPPGIPPNPVLDQFHGRSVSADDSWKVRRDGGTFDFITGATITSRAVTAAVEQAGKTLLRCKGEFMKGAQK